jgi:uncharacterized protein YdhG (YjbR/CyaY superfamily)
MAKINCKSVDHYIAAQPEAVQAVLECVRSIIRRAVPTAEESISYQIPTYKLHGRAMIHFAGWKQHYSLYPASGLVQAALADELAPYQVSKGTIRFPLAQPVPAKLIARIATLRAQEVTERELAKPTAPKKR